MRLLRNLPIAAKLALSSLATLALLGVLSWSVLSMLQAEEARNARVASLQLASSGVDKAWQEARGMGMAVREMQFQQTPETVADALVKADRHARLAAEALEAAASVQEVARPVRQASESLAAYGRHVRETASLRTAMLEERDSNFVTLQGRFDSALQATRREIALEDLMPSELDEILEHVRLFQVAVLTMRDAVNRFLATGDSGMQERVSAADTSAESHLPYLLNARLTPDMKETAEELAQTGRKMRDSARRVFERAAALSNYVGTETDRSGEQVEAHLGVASREFADVVKATYEEAHEAHTAARRDLLLLAGGIALVLALSGVVTARAVARPIAAMTRLVQKMADGDTSASLGNAGRRDEVGRMAAALEVLRAAVKRAFVQGQMIEQIPIGVMTAEGSGDFRIGYVNQQMRAVLAGVEEHLPVKLDQLVGSSIDIFHEDPQAQRALLADPARLPHRARIRLGEEVLELSISALHGADGSYAGPMLAWHVVTGQVRLSDRFERSVAGIVRVVDDGASEMQRTAAAMSEMAESTGQRLAEVTTASRDASGNVQAVAASAEELAQ
ncbi:MAG TPA: HAMP domain-containing protein, partial [Acetobacteraceae bacterium]